MKNQSGVSLEMADNESVEIGDIYIPTLIIYGTNDMAIDVKSVDNSKKFLKGRYKIEKLDSGHWLIQESFEEVSKISNLKSVTWNLLTAPSLTAPSLWERHV